MRWLILFLCLQNVCWSGEMVARRVISFWDSKTDDSLEESYAAKMVELPLNYLGLDVEYYDIKNPLPDLSKRTDVRGIVICFNEAVRMQDPIGFINWATGAIDLGKKVIILRHPGFLANDKHVLTETDELNRLYERIGFMTLGSAVDLPFSYKIVAEDPHFIGFEQKYPPLLFPFDLNRIKPNQAHSLLTVSIPGRPETASDLIIIGRNGAFVSEKYATNYDLLSASQQAHSLGWYLNPFKFFEVVFHLEDLPIPDTTTTAGRRIFFSYSDGDSWGIPSEIERYQAKEVICAEVMLEEVVKPNPDIPVSMGVIAADVDSTWVGTRQTQQTAKKFFEQPQVEAATHTYSHPFQWSFFEGKGAAEEVYFLHLYPYGSWQNAFLSWMRAKYYELIKPAKFKTLELKWGYVIPRAYANQPFNLEKEIVGSAEFLNQFMPEDQKIGLLLWSGDGVAWDQAVELCYQHNLANLGGGSNRLDPEFPSVLFLSPIGRKPGGWIQIYSVSNAEVSYTYDWTKRFFGFKYLPITWENTEKPRRLKPAALYYHSYSAQFEDSLKAVLDNLAYIRKQKIIPLHVSEYVAIGLGFYSVELEKIADFRWKIKNRQGLQTIRFEHGKSLTVNLLDSVGVVGFNKNQDVLYIYLDATVAEPIIQIQENKSQMSPSF
jgi:polysaccharide biosynthesis protein PelA